MTAPEVAGASVILSNVMESYRPFVRQLDPQSRRGWEAACARTSSLALLWSGDRKLVVTPHAMDPDFVGDVLRVTGFRDVSCVAPAAGEGDLCAAVARDPSALEIIRGRLCAGATLRAWEWTPESRGLRDLLGAGGEAFACEVPPGTSRWAAAYLDSKSGFRDATVRDPSCRQAFDSPFGWICSDLDTAALAAASWADRGLGAVVKADGGAGGIGTVVVPPGPARRRMPAVLGVAARACPPLSRGPLVVEEFVGRGGRSPRPVSVFATAVPSGATVLHGQAAFAVTAGGRYLGAVVGRGSMDDRVRDRLHAIAEAAGRLANRLGYLGPFGVDALVEDGGRVRTIEFNARRTLVTHLHDVGAVFGGAEWQRGLALASADRVLIEECACYGRVRERLSRLWCPLDGRRRGVFVASVDPPCSAGSLEVGLVAVGEDARDASDLLREAHRALGVEMASALNDALPVGRGP